VQPVDDLPAVALARVLLEEQHLLTTEHTMTHWEEAFFLPGPVIDRDNRENWARAGSKELPARAREEVARRLAAYEPVITDESAVREMQRLLRAGSDDERPLPEVPSPAATAPARAARRGGRERRQTRRRG
jgi:trimethylamine--corrinoid protein Co-methyltransferase